MHESLSVVKPPPKIAKTKYTVDPPPPKDSDLPPLEGLGLDSKFRLKISAKY